MTENTAKLPHWDLTPIYPSVESKEFLSDLASIAEASSCLDGMISSGALYDIVMLLDRTDALISNTSSYCYALLSTDTSNPSYIGALDKVENASIRFRNAYSRFVAALPMMKDRFSDPRLKDYGYVLSEMLAEAEHLMSGKEEELANELLRVSAGQWSRLQEAVTSSIGEGGKTLIELRGLASDPDRTVRKDAYERELKILKEHEIALSYALNGVKGTVLILERKRRWADPIDRSLCSSRISHKALDALISTLEDAIPMFRRYLAVKARLLGLGKLDWYDIIAPVSKTHRRYDYEDARRIIVSSYSSFSPEMGEFAEYAFSHNWIDAEPRRGKVGGAYDTSFKKSKVSRVLSNFDYTYESVSTLAHELGHAYHDYVVRNLPPLLSEYPMTLAETASIFGETVVFTEVLKTLDDDEKLPVIEQFVSSACQTCLDILSRFYFERSCFKRRKDGELTADEMCALMLEAQERTYGDAVAEKHRYMWAVKSHYYSEDFSFYNYPYAFGQLFALGLFRRSGGMMDFPSTYRSLLLRTGMESAKDVAAAAGCDIENPDFWHEGIAVIEEYAKELENWL